MKQLIFVALFLGISFLADNANAAESSDKIKNIVLVHGAFVDGSGWQGVYNRLKKAGYNVLVVQNRTTSLADDVAVTKQVLASLDGPAVLVGHSYGGAVISEAGNDAKVYRLVYVAAFVPDTGESVKSLLADPPPGAAAPPIVPLDGGYLALDRAKFPGAFAGDLPPSQAAFMADSQVPWGGEALTGTVTTPSWRKKATWYVLATQDKTIPPALQRQMAKRANATIIEVSASHAVYISKPQSVVEVIESAANSGAK